MNLHETPISGPFAGLPFSGLELVRDSTRSHFFDAAGRRCAVMGQEGGAMEIWTYPFKALRHLEFFVAWQGQERPLKDLLKAFRIRPEASTAFFAAEGLDIQQTVLVPLNCPAALFVFSIKCSRPVSLRAEASSDLRLMWPAENFFQNACNSPDPATGVEITAAGATQDAAAFGWHERPNSAESSDEWQTVVYAVASSDSGAEQAIALWEGAAKNWRDLYTEAVSYYSQLLASSTRLESSDPQLDRAFQWAIIGTDKCFMHTPGVGSGFVAGFNGSGDSGRPGFGWYFGRDSSWTGYAVNDYGDFGKVADNIRLLAKYQIAEGPDTGKIFHELSAAHERQPGMQYAYPAADATPFFVTEVANYFAWTGDLAFVREMWPQVVKAIEWCYRMDVDGDLLVDNPPAGHQWYDGGEKNLIDMVAIWCKGLLAAADLADAVGEPHGAKWRADAQQVEHAINHDFWNEANSYLFDRKLPDGSMLDISTANPAVALLWGLVEPERAARAVCRMMQPDMTTDWGMRTHCDRSPAYSPTGYHEGMVWPLTTGWASLAGFANGFAEAGWHHLKANAMLTEDFCLGYITEVLMGDRREPGGCPHQAWSEAMVILPVVEGIFGVKPDWPARTLTAGVQLPDALEHAALRNLRLGEARIQIEAVRLTSGTRMSVTSSEPGLTLVLTPVVPEGRRLNHIKLNGQMMASDEYELVDMAGPMMAVVQLKLNARIDLELNWNLKDM